MAALLPLQLAGQANYELAITSKTTEIEWKQADLLAAQRELEIVSQFLTDYEAKATQLTDARTQLVAADTKLASIQQGNLVKLTIRMGIETYNTVSDTINLGKGAANALLSHGVTSAVGTVAFDQVTNNLTNESRAALGMDAASLSTPRTARIQAVSDAARAAFPDLARVQQTLGLSLEAVKAAAYHEDGTELGDTGAILRKNLMVRDEIAVALAKLDNLNAESAAAKDDADSRIDALKTEVQQLGTELAALKTELEVLKAQWSEAEATARAVANAAALVPVQSLPAPTVDLIRLEGENDWDYLLRRRAAVIAAAQTRWDAEAPPILAAIAASKEAITTGEAELGAAITTSVTNPGIASFIYAYGGRDRVDAATTSAYTSTASSHASLSEWLADVQPVSGVLPNLITQAETLADEYTTLFNHQHELTTLLSVLSAAEAPMPSTYAPAMDVPGLGQAAAEAHAVQLAQLRAQLPNALANAQAQLDQLAAATDAWGTGISAVRADLDGNLAAAESALAELISRGQAWESVLAASAGLVTDSANGSTYSRLGYYSGDTFVPVIRHEFSQGLYEQNLLAAIATPGPAGLAAARDLRAKFDTLVAVAPALKDAYDAANQRFQAAYARVAAYTLGFSGFPVLQDWASAAVYSSAGHPIDASGVTNQETRYRSLYNTVTYNHITSPTGGEPVFGQTVVHWIGLPRMRQLFDPGLDDPVAYLPHRLLGQKEAVVADGPTWLPLPPGEFNTRYTAVLGELWDVQNLANQSYQGATYDPIILAFYSELSDLHDAYVAAHPAAVITTQPAGSSHSVPAGTTASATLSVTATGDFLTYEWYETHWPQPEYEYTWTKIEGANASTYVTGALSATNYYRVHIINPGGTTISQVAAVEIIPVYPTPAFTSADQATGQVGIPFTWKFTTDITSWIFTQMPMLPPGITFNYGTASLEGTPTAAGVYNLTVTANNNGSAAYQTFRLTIESGTLAPFDAWVQQWTTAEQRQNSAYTLALGTPAGDGIPNLLKFAFNLVGSGTNQAPTLDTPYTGLLAPDATAGLPAVGVDTGGRLTLLYLRRKAAGSPGVTYAVEFSSTLAADSWAENTSATETSTSVDDTWERVLVTDSAAMTGTRFVRVKVERP